MELREAYKAMIAAYNGGWAAMAAALGMSQSSLENRIYERKGQSVSVHLAEQLQSTSGTTFFAEAIARKSGGVFIQLPDIPEVGNDELFEKFLQLNERLGDLSREYQSATADSIVDQREWARLNRMADDMHRTIAEIMAITQKVFMVKEETT